jgi:hypothetical protein
MEINFYNPSGTVAQQLLYLAQVSPVFQQMEWVIKIRLAGNPSTFQNIEYRFKQESNTIVLSAAVIFSMNKKSHSLIFYL